MCVFKSLKSLSVFPTLEYLSECHLLFPILQNIKQVWTWLYEWCTFTVNINSISPWTWISTFFTINSFIREVAPLMPSEITFKNKCLFTCIFYNFANVRSRFVINSTRHTRIRFRVGCVLETDALISGVGIMWYLLIPLGIKSGNYKITPFD